MAANMKLLLELSANASALKEGMRQSSNAVSGFAQKAREEAQSLRRVYDSLSGRLAAMGLSAGMGFKMWQSAGLDKSLTQIGQTAGAADKEVVALRGDLFRLGKDTGQDVDNLKEGLNVLIQTGLNMKESKATLDGLNTAMAVTGAEAKILANGLTVAATAFQFDLSKPNQALELLDKMTVAGRLGNAELQNLSDIFARVGVNSKSAGMSFDKTLGFIEALSMVERQPERLATLADSTLRIFTNLRYTAKAMQATKISFFDKSGARRDALEVLQDFKKQYDALKTDKARAIWIQRAFGEADLDTIKGLRTLFQGDALARIGKFSKEISEAGGTLRRDLNDATRNLIDQTGRVKANLREAADTFVQPINKTLSELIKWTMDKKKNAGLELSGKEMLGYGTAAVLGTWAAARYGGKLIEWLRGKPGGKLSGGPLDAVKTRAETAGRITEFLGVQYGAKMLGVNLMPVYVVNWPASFSGSRDVATKGKDALKTAGDLAATAGGAAALSRAGTIMAWLKTMGGAAWRGAGGLIMKYSPLFLPRQLLIPAAAGYGAGWALNQGAGAAAGLASGGKYHGPGWLGEMIYDSLHREVKNDFVFNFRIDKDGQIIGDTNTPGGNVQINLDRGNFGY